MARGGSKPSAAPKKTANTAKQPTGRTENDTAKQQEDSSISQDLQQKCLDIFRDALKPSSEDSKILQEVKGHLFNRDFAAAFGKEEYLRVYASRWSPSRALAYLRTFADLGPRIQSSSDGGAGNCIRAVCVGGGAGAEIVGLGACLSTLSGDDAVAEQKNLHVDLVDIADWSAVVQQLHAGLTSPPELSKYASQAKKIANKALASPSALSVEFLQLDALSSETTDQGQLSGLLEEADLVTFMFTLNELYSTSLPATQALLNRITGGMKAGCHLLVVDSPGSYSTVSLDGAEKKYPMQWLLDHTMLKQSGDEDVKWVKLVEDDSRWFRLSKELNYPIALEDMRFQMHLYQRV